ncbi:hypothetical protein, partial [Streptomyces toxytricini]|uniref:hypothetical protein n=1 Tax=Streptomyces toxytricini TaxID=67369 RepID=UPI0034157E1B
PASDPADETAVLPPVRPDAPRPRPQAHSAVRPTARRPDHDPADRVPPGIFRDADDDMTRELPLLDEAGRPRSGRPSWAQDASEDDDIPTLADELLGPRDDAEDEENGRRNR